MQIESLTDLGGSKGFGSDQEHDPVLDKLVSNGPLDDFLDPLLGRRVPRRHSLFRAAPAPSPPSTGSFLLQEKPLLREVFPSPPDQDQRGRAAASFPQIAGRPGQTVLLRPRRPNREGFSRIQYPPSQTIFGSTGSFSPPGNFRSGSDNLRDGTRGS